MKPPVLLIHGMWSTPATFDRLRPVLEAAGHRTHAPAVLFHDRPACLPPAPALGELSITAYVDHLVAEAGKLGAPPVILGHSMGGLLAQMVAQRIPHAGLVLLSPAAAANSQAFSIDPFKTLKNVVLKWGWWEKPTLCDEAGARWGIYNGVPEDVTTREIAALVWDSGRVLAEMALPPLFGNVTRVDYARLNQPALVVVGLQDRITPPAIARATARNLTGQVDYQELPGVPHWLFWGETEDRLAAMVVDWLKTLG
ncbi:alpha/beta hydrolase [Sandarakinorhabdus oryzae]|uniref:alpha/beta hydrolase n=1 Tax=Sandarakinorhabdus oryzae TaxID=2675220 RepID=UPI0038B4922C